MLPVTRAIVALSLSMLVVACAQLPALAPGEQAEGFELTGRVAVRYGTESASGRVQWRHTRRGDDLLITNPLGQGVARIARGEDGVMLETSDGRVYRAADAEQLTEQVLGWRLPLAGLSDWVRGRARAGAPAEVSHGDGGTLRLIEQDGWQVTYLSHDEAGPTSIRLLHPGVEIRLVVESRRELGG